MERQQTTFEFDPALSAFLASRTSRENDDSLSALISAEVEPAIRSVLRRKFRTSLNPGDFSFENQDALELLGEVKLLILTELSRLKSSTDRRSVQNLGSYVATVTLNSYRQYLRSKYPRRQQLKNKLRYLLTHHPNFSLWESDDGSWLCGLENEHATAPARRLNSEEFCAQIADMVSSQKLFESGRVIDLLNLIFRSSMSAVPFNTLLSAVAQVQQIKDEAATSFDSVAAFERVASTETANPKEIEQHELLSRVWAGICDLPLRHRRALLLNLKDKRGDCLVTLLPILRIASIPAIADALDFPALEFASVWRDLPWDDNRIAEFMGLTRQQVINLRQSARSKLAREIGSL